MSVDTVDGTAEEIGTDVEVTTGQEIAPANLFGTDDPVEVVEAATRVANALKDVIVAKRLFQQIQGKEHVLVDGWQLVGAMLGVTAVCVATEPVDGGYKATVEARTADGRVIGRADALCTKHEKRGPWKNADDYARLSMAQTRATAKALKGPLGFVVSLAGYSATPAEEMTFAEPDAPAPAAWVSGGITQEQSAAIEAAFVKLGQPFDRMNALLEKVGAAPNPDLASRVRSLDGAQALKVQKALAKALTEAPPMPEGEVPA